MRSEYIIIGGGVVGTAIGWGLRRRGHEVLILDGDDRAHRASRGNFGLVWVQSKGMDFPDYARWSQRSSRLWASFAEELSDNTGTDLALEQKGGLDYFFDEAELEERIARYEGLRQALDGDYPYEVLRHNELKREEPNIGPDVVGATLHHQDGHVNTLRLYQAQVQDFHRLGGQLITGKRVERVDHDGAFCLTCADGSRYHGDKVVLAAGLGAMDLAPKLGFGVHVRPERGQVMITEKLPPLIHRPSPVIRQVSEGGIQIGVSNEDTGFDDSTTVDVSAAIAAQAIRLFPALSNASMLRIWGALRILPQDGYPIYARSTLYPNASMVTCHSGITLAAVHAKLIPEWLERSDTAPNLDSFSDTRFQTA